MNQKHPIDELFRRKLANHELPVEDRLKQVFLEKNQPKKKRAFPIWLFALAASFIAVLGFFWIGQSDNTNLASQKVTANTAQALPTESQKVVTNSNEEVHADKVTEPDDVITSRQMVAAKSAPSQEVSSYNKPKIKNEEKVQLISPVTKTATGVIQLDERIPDELTLALMESEKKTKRQEPKEEKNKSVFQRDVGKTIIIVATEYNKEDKIFIPEISEDSRLTMVAANEIAIARNEEEKSLIAKVFTGIQKLKHGEKVDLSLMARNEPSDETFIGNEREELKQRINWIKSKIAKR